MPVWRDGIMKSRKDGRESPYRVLLPPEYELTDRRYPTLFLLHGLFGTFENWTELACLKGSDGIIIVMPDSGDNWYCDAAEHQEWSENRIVVDLIANIDGLFRTKASRDARSIAGNSMGGYGALKIALRHPHLFSFAASFSGAFDAANWTDQSPPIENWDAYRPSITKIFGKDQSNTRMENDIFRLVSEYRSLRTPEIYFDCGINDPFLESNKRLSRHMRENGIPHQFQVLPGGHDWDYWTDRGVFLTKLIGERSAV